MSEQPSTSLDQEKIKKDLQKFEDGRWNDYKEIRTHALTLLDTYEIQASCLPSFDAVNDSGWKNSFDGTVTVQDRINAYEKLAYELSQEIKQASNMSNFHRQNSIIDELSQRIMQAHNNITSTIAQKNKSTLSISTQGNQNDTTLDQHNTSILYQKNLALRTKPWKTKDILQELPRQMDTWSKKIVEENAHNPVYQQHIIKTMNRARVAFQKRPITTKEINTICVNMLLMLNDASQTDITDMSKFEEPSVSAIYEFQKKYETISWWSAADGIVWPKTIQQLCHNIGITLDQITLEWTFARDKAKSIDKESWYTYKQFVVEWLNTYKAYLRTIESQMHLQLFSGADEALDAHIITLEQAIFNIQNSTMHDYEIAWLIDTLILNPRDMRSWIQSLNWIWASYFDTLLQSFSESATVQLTNLLKKPWNFQTAKQSMLDIFRSIDQVNGTIERKSEAYADLARTEASKSREAYNDTDLKQMLDRIRTTMSDASHVDQIKDIITDSSVSDKEKTIKNYIANTMKWSTRNDNLFNQKLAYMFDTDEMENLVKSISDMIKNEWPNKIKMKQEITEEKKKLAVLSDNNKLNEDGQLRLQALTQATENDDSWDTYINDAYQASISTTISSILEDYMVSNALAKYDPHAYRRRDTIWLYADIKGVWNATSDQVSNIITNTAIDLWVEIAIAMVSFATAWAAWVAIYGTRLAASTAAKATVRTLLSRVGTLFPKLLTKEWMWRVWRALARNAVKWAAYTTTSEVLRNARTAKDWSDYGTNLLSGMKNNFLSNTAMLGILKYLGGSFQALKVTSTNVSKPLASLTKREAIKMTQEMVKNRAIAWLGFFATKWSIATVDYVSKALIWAWPYSPEDFINTLAEGLTFELIWDMIDGWLKLPRHSTPTRSNGQSLLPVLHNNQDATLVIKGDHATLTQNGKNIQTIDLTNHRQSRQEQLASINQKINEIYKGRDDMKIETTLQKYFNKDISQKIKDAVCKDFNTDHNGMQQLRQLWDTKKRLEESLKHTQDPATISTDQSLIRTRSQITENHRATSALEQQVQDPTTLTNQENTTKFIADTKTNLTSISPK